MTRKGHCIRDLLVCVPPHIVALQSAPSPKSQPQHTVASLLALVLDCLIGLVLVQGLCRKILTKGSPSQLLPLEDKGTEESANEDADDDVAVVVHCQKHDKVSHCKLNRVKQGA